MIDQKKYWFRAKKYGWGWGLPTAWQGWVVFSLFIALSLLDASIVLPRFGSFLFVSCLAALVAIFVATCWITGEPPRWRWGGKDVD